MKCTRLIVLFLVLFQGCRMEGEDSSMLDEPVAYLLKLDGLRTAETGRLDVVGEPGDYFGRFMIDAEPPRTFAVRLAASSTDSLYFTLPGDGYLVLRDNDSTKTGAFKYFGLRATLEVEREENVDEALRDLTLLRPLGMDLLSTSAQETFPATDPNGGRLYFTRDNTILFTDRQGSEWSVPDTASFSGVHNDSAPYFSPDGKSLLFTSNRPNPTYQLEEGQRARKDIWTISQQPDGSWGAPVPLPSPVNVDSLGEYHGGLTRDGSVYFVSFGRTGGYGRSDLYRAVPEGDGYTAENLGASINTEASEADVFVDPDERFILFVATELPGGYGTDDIYVSYRNEDDWTEPRNLGPAVNSFAYEYGPWIDFSEGYLYFNSDRRGSADLYRVSLSEIDLDLENE